MSLPDLETKGFEFFRQMDAPSAVIGVVAGGIATAIATWLVVIRPLRKRVNELEQDGDRAGALIERLNRLVTERSYAQGKVE